MPDPIKEMPGKENPSPASRSGPAGAESRAQPSREVNVPDPIEKHFTDMTSSPENLKRLEDFIKEQQAKGLKDDATFTNLPGITFGEYKQIFAAIQSGQGQRETIEQLVHEVRQPHPTPETQPNQPIDWRESLPEDQRQRLADFEAKIANFDASQLQMLLSRLKELETLVLTDGWQSKEIRQEDAGVYLRAIEAKLKENNISRVSHESHNIIRTARITGWRPPPDTLNPEIDLSTGNTNGT